MSILGRAKAWGNNTKQGINNAWVGGDRSGGFGARDILGASIAGGVAGPVGAGGYLAMKRKGYVDSKTAAADAASGGDGVPTYERPPEYITQEGTMANAARMNDNSGVWQQLAENKQRQEEAMQMDKQARMGNAGLAQARSGLAMRGGLRSGAGERMALAARDSDLAARQNIASTGVADRIGIGMKAQDMYRDTEKTNAGFQQQANLQNAGNMMNREQLRNTGALTTYTELMKQKGADYAARMQAKASSKPTLLSDPLGYVKQYV